MSATTDAEADAVLADRETYESLSREEQRRLLDDGFEQSRPDWETRSAAEKSKAFEALTAAREDAPTVTDDMSETERAMAEALQDTRTAELFAELDDTPTVPFELRRIPSDLREIVEEVGEIIHSGQDAESVEDLDELIEASSFEDGEAIDEWLVQFLDFVTVDEAFDAERWRTGRGLVEGTREHLMLDIYLYHQEGMARTAEFRVERAGLSDRR